MEARCAGKSCLVIDDGDPKSGSRNASAICDPNAYNSDIFSKYWPPSWNRSHLKDSIHWLLEIGGEWVTERFWNQYQQRDMRDGHTVIYLPSPSCLTDSIGERLSTRVTGFGESKGGVTLETEAGRFTCQHLVVCAGYRTDDVLGLGGLEPVGVTGLYGRGINAKGNPLIPHPVSVMIAPYVKHTVRVWPNGLWKVGDTAERKPNDKKLDNLRTVGKMVLGDYQEVAITEGFRPVLDRFTVDKVSGRVIIATGGHRLGLGLARLVAVKVGEMIR
jgi:hypothetical protein|tara:strand:- start:5484 stop:6305 length:822 start_codon:yes stop_codon:yes gene_type:complete